MEMTPSWLMTLYPKTPTYATFPCAAVPPQSSVCL